VACQKDEFETVIDFVDAIFNSDAGHCLSFGSQERSFNRGYPEMIRRLR
jgi:hypothetical protein